MVKPQKVVHGDDLLYRFFQTALNEEPELFAKVPQMMLEAMGVWIPREVYRDWPVLLPWVVRDPTCRGSHTANTLDEWGSPNERGYLRDDNSLIKALPRSLKVKTPNAGGLSGARMGNEFVASHIWRRVHHSDLASRIPLLNSFVPNLVWLPSQVAKLTDREGGVVQKTLQSLAFAIYRDAPVAPHLKEIVEEIWLMVPNPEPITVSDLNFNWFEATDQFVATRASRLNTLVEALEYLDNGQPLVKKVMTSRYTAGLPGVSKSARRDLHAYLRRFLTN